MVIFKGENAYGKIEAELCFPNKLRIKTEDGEESFLLGTEKDGKETTPYLGYTGEEIIKSGRDLLAEKVLEKGFPSRETLRGALPGIAENGSYAVLGSEASWNSYSVSPSGDVILQMNKEQTPDTVVFRPGDAFSGFNDVKPKISLLDGELPLLVLSFEKDGKFLFLFYACEPQDCDRAPTLWILSVLTDGESAETGYQRASYPKKKSLIGVSGEDFFEVFLSSVRYFRNELDSMASFSLPDGKLSRNVRSVFSTAFTTFAGDHPHYGHKFYGLETHDYFPPTFLSYIETMLLYGNISRARRALEHLLCHGFDSLGRLAYRQGDEEVHGVSASEYGQFFTLLESADGFPEISPVISEYLGKIKKTAKTLASEIKETKEYPSLKLISMCAEADTNGRIHIYAQNNLWAVRGFDAFSKLLLRREDREAEFYANTAKTLLSDTKIMLEKEKITTKYGDLVPFRSGYTPLPYNLSGCRDTSVPLTDEEFSKYNDTLSWVREDFDAKNSQDFLENSYANYRYYPEMLSSALLSEEEETAIENLRRALGGEVLGMTRLWKDGIDDWPVINVANYLLRSGQKERYWLLLYAHLLFHGEEEKGIWYEQRSIPGTWTANDCVPSLLTVPLMLGKAFVSENAVTGEIELLKGVPDGWFEAGFEVCGLYVRGGRVSVKCADGKITVRTEKKVKIFAPEGYETEILK